MARHHTCTPIHFLHKLLSILSICPIHLNLFLFTHSTIPQSTPFAWPPIPHLSYMLSVLSPFHLVTPLMTRWDDAYSNTSNILSVIPSQVEEQQSTLQQAGVPGFHITSNPMEIKVQMYIMGFIMKIGGIKFPHWPRYSNHSLQPTLPSTASPL